MQRGLCTRVYIAIYAYIQGIYAYIEPEKYIFRSYIYISFLCLFVCFCVFCMLHMCKWVQIGANACFVAHHNEITYILLKAKEI